MNENIILLHSNEFDFEDPKTNRRIQGIKLQYIMNDDLDPVAVDSQERGYQVAEAILTLENKYMLNNVPGVYKTKYVTRVNAKKQTIQKLVAIDYVCKVPELFQKPVAAQKVV